jgi:hypothetical protein
MKSVLKFFGWFFVLVAIIGGPQLMAREGIHTYTLGAEVFYIVAAWLCFWGSNRIKKRNEEK